MGVYLSSLLTDRIGVRQIEEGSRSRLGGMQVRGSVPRMSMAGLGYRMLFTVAGAQMDCGR